MTAGTLTITEFLLARIATEEAEARDAIAKRNSIDFIHPPEVPDLTFEAYEDVGVPAVLVGPERVLAECAAKRRIIERHAVCGVHDEDCDACLACGDGSLWPCDDLRVLASVYSAHPDFRAEWAS